MIPISPQIYPHFTCPQCTNSSPTIEKIIFQGVHILADVTCAGCNGKFLMDFPIGHAMLYPTTIDKNTHTIVGEKNKDHSWFKDTLLEAYLSPKDDLVEVKKTVSKTCEEVIILNCLDVLYGHVLLKIFNATHYQQKHPDKGLILIIPQSFAWLVPDGIAEVWTIDLRLSQFKNWYKSLENVIQDCLPNYKKVYLSLGYPIPDYQGLSIEPFSKVAPFSLDKFPTKPLQVSFIWREDRLWFRNKLEQFCFLAFRKFKLFQSIPLLKKIFISFQIQRVNKLGRYLKKSHPSLTLNVIGLGKTGRFSKSIQDLRSSNITFETEKQWCEKYAESHIVVGIHGSNMLLPTAHAAGFVEIMPDERLGNWLQDIFQPSSGKVESFLGRFVPDYSSPRRVANYTSGILAHFEKFYLREASRFHPYDEVDKVDDIFKNFHRG
ncbi:MAG TPA: hypothetical protein DCS93_17980 [Microscillaceae bacterium]|nr:hypothetical protein [Microscillaceae bacterium]